MIVYVEYNENGDIFHVAAIHTAESRDAPRPPGEMTAVQETAHRKSVAAAIAARETAAREELHAHAKTGKRLLVLPDGTPTPHPDTHKVERGALRELTQAEQAARQTL